MMNPEKESLKDVLLAMEKLNGHFEGKINEFRRQGKEEREISGLVKGAMAMKDAAGIYLAWANHYIEQLHKAEGLSLPDMEEGEDV